MQVHNTSRIGSYCENIRLTPMHRAWSEGKTVFPIEPPKPRLIDKDPSEMTLEELELTQNMELPHISRQSWMLTGAGTWSLDKPSPTTGRTIAELVPEDNPIHTGFKTEKPLSELTVEELRAYEKFCAERTRHTGLTPYKYLHPAKRDKIEWERASAQSGPEIRRRYARHQSTGNPIIEIRGIKTDDKTYPIEAKKYLRLLRDEWGHVPTLEEIEERGAALKAEWQERIENNVGIPKTWYEEAYLNGDHHLDPHNYDVFDAEYHSSFEYIADPDHDFDEDFVREQGLDPEEVYDALPRSLKVHIRSKRDAERVIRNPSHNDALWHARIGQAIELGFDFSKIDGPRTTGRIVRDAVDAAWSKISDPDKTGINALSTLKD